MINFVQDLRDASIAYEDGALDDAAQELERVYAERDALLERLDSALTVCRCAVRVIESSAYQGVSDEDCDLENAVKNWQAGKP